MLIGFSDSNLPYLTLLPQQRAAIQTVLATLIGISPPPLKRAAVLAMSGTRRKYHYFSVQVIAIHLAKDKQPTKKSLRSISLAAGLFLHLVDPPLQNIIMAHCLALLFHHWLNRECIHIAGYEIYKEHLGKLKTPHL